MKKQLTVFLLLFLSIGAVFAQGAVNEEKNSMPQVAYIRPKNSISLNYGIIPFNTFFFAKAYVTGSFALDYHYMVGKRVSVGMNFSYAASTPKDISDMSPGEQDKVGPYDGYHRHLINIMPSVRFYWFNNKYVTLYSAVSTGVRYVNIGEEKYKQSMHYTLIGATVGKDVCFKYEFGGGELGFVRVGVVVNF